MTDDGGRLQRPRTIDLRSDTVTRPTPAMRAAMAAAAVGDDGYHDDPTVTRLEERAAALLGKEAGLFMPSGTMSNLVAALTHCPPDRQVVVLAESHIGWTLTYDGRLGGLVAVVEAPIDGRGVARPAELEVLLDAAGTSGVGLFCYENTYNLTGGCALAPAEMAEMVSLARNRGIPTHLDGARIFNAAVALGVPAATLAAGADSVTFCLSKGLAAPVGSVLCGSGELIERARHHRQYLGGTMRQAGIVAAAGLVALESMIDRLAEDHANARCLAAGLAAIPGIRRLFDQIETNLVFFDVAESRWTADAVKQAMTERGVEIGGYSTETVIRAVTHLDVSRADCEQAVAILRVVLAEQGG